MHGVEGVEEGFGVFVVFPALVPEDEGGLGRFASGDWGLEIAEALEIDSDGEDIAFCF